MKSLISFTILTLTSLLLPAAVLGQITAYVGATIETADQAGRLENATLLVDGDKIVAVGTDVEIPNAARIVSLDGKTIMPGIVDPYFVFSTGNSAQQTRTVTFRGRTFTVPVRGSFDTGSFQKIGEFFYPYRFNFMPAIRSGITTANLVSDGRGLSAYANLLTERTPEMLFQDEGQLFAKVTNETGALDTIRKPLKTEDKSNSGNARSAASSRGRSTGSSSSDETKKHWDAVKEGKQHLFVNVNSAAAVAYVLQLAREHEKVQYVIVATGDNLFQLLDQLESLENLTIVLQPGIDTVPYTRDLMNVPRLLQEREIPFSLSLSLSNSQLRASQDDPLFPVATLVHTGLDRDIALQALTIKGAKLMGLEKTHGSIAKDKHANFLVFDGDPLATGSRLEQVYLNGKQIHEN